MFPSFANHQLGGLRWEAFNLLTGFHVTGEKILKCVKKTFKVFKDGKLRTIKEKAYFSDFTGTNNEFCK